MARPCKRKNSTTAKLIEEMRQYGLSIELISKIVKLAPATLRKLYSEELDRGIALANFKIAKCLFEKAINGDTACLIFWCKTQMGWREKSHNDAKADVLLPLYTVQDGEMENKGHSLSEREDKEAETGILVVPGMLSEEEWERYASQ